MSTSDDTSHALDPYLNPKEKDTSLETEPTLWRKLLVEGLGTFLLGFTAELSVDIPFGGYVAGAFLVTVLFFGLQVSGSHMNPAITLTVMARYGMPLFSSIRDVVLFGATQCLCALGGATIAFAIFFENRKMHDKLFPNDYAPNIPALLEVKDATGYPLTILFELVLAFGFCCIALTCASAVKNRVSSSQMLILMTYTMLCANVMGPISGAVLNPAVGLALNIVGAYHYEDRGAKDLWVFAIATCGGGLLAGSVFRLVAWYKNKQPRSVHASFKINSRP